MNNNKKIREADGESYPPRSRQGVDSGIRFCGCPYPKDYPKIDIHNSKCKRRRLLEGQPVANKGEIPKVAPSGRKLSGIDAPRSVTPTHQTFFSHEYTHLIVEQNSVWLSMAKRFDKKHNK